MQNHCSPIHFFVAILLSAVISACGGRATALPSPVPSPTHNQAPTQAPVTRIVMTATTVPQTPSSAATILPSRTPAATDTIDSEVSQRAFDFAVTKTQIASFPTTCKDIDPHHSSISPGGKWIASSCEDGQKIVIANREGIRFDLRFIDYVHQEHLVEGKREVGSLDPTDWIDDDYLFFFAHLGGSGGGTCFYGYGVNSLYRVDLKTGVVSPVLNPRPTITGYIFAFSPSSRRLAYYDWEHLKVLDLMAGETLLLDYEGKYAGDLTWSPDGEKLAYATCQDSADHESIKKSTVQIYDLETGETRAVLQVGENHHLYVASWEEGERLKIVDRDAISWKEQELLFDESSGQFQTPTP